MKNHDYLMESAAEAHRLEVKTDDSKTAAQAAWAGLAPGMRVADLGCGPGRTSSVLHGLVQPGGETVGVDFGPERIAHANENYLRPGLSFHCRDIREPLDDLGQFDFVWLRFVLEYYRAESVSLAKKAAALLKPGGILCLADLDNNCLNHFEMPARLSRTIASLMTALQDKGNFDPFVGRKLYAYLYDLGFADIRVEVVGHHVIYGELQESDAFNWLRKAEVAPAKLGFTFELYPGGHPEFIAEFRQFFADPRRFTYSPLVLCRGCKPRN
ncbi:MAG: methyltransferase domain-containing protein [Desulfobulbaceae bacterium]|nr:methyltransferase domain-containing protein [Desulfobulbaceae bacterium]